MPNTIRGNSLDQIFDYDFSIGCDRDATVEWAVANVIDPAIQGAKDPNRVVELVFDQRGTSAYADLKRIKFHGALMRFQGREKEAAEKHNAAEKLATEKAHKDQLSEKDKEIARLQKLCDSLERSHSDLQERFHVVNGENIRYKAIEEAQAALAAPPVAA